MDKSNSSMAKVNMHRGPVSLLQLQHAATHSVGVSVRACSWERVCENERVRQRNRERGVRERV